MQTIKTLVLISLLLAANNLYSQFYSTEIDDSSGDILSITDFTISPCNGNTLQVGIKSKTNGQDMLWAQLNSGSNLLANLLIPNPSNASDLDLTDKVLVEPYYNQTTGVCEGYLVVFSAKTIGETFVETHLLFLDPALSILWHNIPYDNIGQHTIAKDCIVKSGGTTGDVLIELGFSKTLIAGVQLTSSNPSTPLGEVGASQSVELKITNNSQTQSSPKSFMHSPSNVSGAFTVVGSSYDQTYAAFINYSGPGGKAYLYDVDGINSEKDTPTDITFINDLAYVSGITYDDFTNPQPYSLSNSYVLGIDSPFPTKTASGSVILSNQYSLPSNGNQSKSISSSPAQNGLVIAGVSDLLEGPGFPGGFPSIPFISMLDLNGNVVWDREYNPASTTQGEFIELKSDNNFIYAAGNTRISTTNYEPEGFMVKTDGVGQINGACSQLNTTSITPLTSVMTPLIFNNNSYGWTRSFITPNNALYTGSNGTVSLTTSSCVGSAGTTISGMKFIDYDCDQIMNNADIPAAGWVVQLRNSSGFLLQTQLTDNSGQYSFNVYTPGTYYIYVITQGSAILDQPVSGFHAVTVTNQTAIVNNDFSSCLCIDQVGVNSPPSWTNYGGSFQARDMAFFDDEIFAIDYNTNSSIYYWDHPTSAWVLFYTNTHEITELETIQGNLFYGGKRPGYFSSFTSSPVLIPTASVPVGGGAFDYDIILDFEEVGSDIYVGGDFTVASSADGGIRKIDISGATPLIIAPTFPFDPDPGNTIVSELAAYNNDVIAMGLFDNGSNIKRIAQFNWATGTTTALGGGLGIPLPANNCGSGCSGDIEVYNDKAYVLRGFNHVLDASGNPVPNTVGYSIYDFITGIWSANTSLGSPASFWDVDEYNGYLYICGFFNNIGGTNYATGVMYDPATQSYSNLAMSNYAGLVESVLYVPNYKNEGDILAFSGEGDFITGKCGGDACVIGAFGQDVCLGSAVYFQSLIPGPGNCTWDFGDGNSSTICSPSHTYAATGTYTVTLHYTNSDGCDTQTTTTVTVSDLEADFIYSQGDCYDMFFDSSPSTLSGQAPYTYSWNVLNDSSIESTAASFTYDFKSLGAGNYLVCLEIIDNKGCADIICQTITVTPDTSSPIITCPPNPAISYRDACDRGAFVSFAAATATDCGDPVNVVCSHQSGDFFPCGLTTVVCTATDDEGDTSTCSIDIIVDCDCLDLIPAVLTCSTTPDTYLFEVDVIDLSGAGGNCSPPSITTSQSGIILTVTNTTSIANGYKVTGEIFTQSCPMPSYFLIDASMTCTCPDSNPVTCYGSVYVPSICCDEISLDPVSVCTDVGNIQIGVNHFGTIKDIIQTNWYVQAGSSCPSTPWGGIPFKSTNGYSDLTIAPGILGSDLCYYVEYLLGPDEGNCTQLTSNISTISLCDPFTCSLTDQDFCFTGSPITPAQLTLNTTIPNCGYTIEWYELINGIEYLLPFSGQSFFQPPTLSISNLSSCSETWTYFAEYNGPCGPIRCYSEITLYNDSASLGTITEISGAPQPLCNGGNAVLEFASNCNLNSNWSWFQKPNTSNTWTNVPNSGTTNTVINTNPLTIDMDYKVELQNGTCPVQEILYSLDVKDVMNIGNLNFQSLSPCFDAGFDFNININPCIQSAQQCDCDYTATLLKNGNIIHTGNYTSNPLIINYIDPALGGNYKGNYQVIIEDNCCEETRASSVLSLERPPAVKIDGPCYTCDNVSTQTLVATIKFSLPFAFTYQWYEVVGSTDIIIPGETSQNLAVSTSGVYKVVVTWSNGCMKSASYTVDNCSTNSITTFSMISSAGSFRFQSTNQGIQLMSPNGTPYLLIANSSGQATTIPYTATNNSGEIEIQALDALVENPSQGAILKYSGNNQLLLKVDNSGQLIQNVVSNSTNNSDITIQNGDLVFKTASRGLVLESPNGMLWRLAVDDLGLILFELVNY